MAHRLISDNPYRLLGTGSRISVQSLSECHRNMMQRALKGENISVPTDMSDLLGEPLRTPYRLDQAKLKLSTPKSRLYHALFWFINYSKVDAAAFKLIASGEYGKAEQLWAANPSFSSYINLAVLYFAQERFSKATEFYGKCFRNEDMTDSFVSNIIGDRYKVSGTLLLAKAVVAAEQELKRLKQEGSTDDRAFAGAGSGVRNAENQSRVKLLPSSSPVNIGSQLQLRKQARNFDRHLNEAFNALTDKIGEINAAYGMDDDDDFISVGTGANPAAGHVLNELKHFFALNYSLITAFRDRCIRSGEKKLYTDYVYNIVSVCNYALHLYAVDLGRMYSPELVQDLRSLLAKVNGLIFRIRFDEGEFMLSSMKRLEDVLPFIYDLSEGYNRVCSIKDPKLQMQSFREFVSFGTGVLERFSVAYAQKGPYLDCSLHLQNAMVLFAVSCISDMVGGALSIEYAENPDVLKSMVAVEQAKERGRQITLRRSAADKKGEEEREQKDPEEQDVRQGQQEDGKSRSDSEENTVHSASPAVNNVTWIDRAKNSGKVNIAGSNIGYDGSENVNEDRDEEKERRKEEKPEILKRRKLLLARRKELRRCVCKDRKYLYTLLDRFERYSVSPSTMTLIKVVRMQLDRLPPPLSLKTLLLMIVLPLLAAGAVLLNIFGQDTGFSSFFR